MINFLLFFSSFLPLFLTDVVPTKILASEYLEMMKQQEREGNSGND